MKLSREDWTRFGWGLIGWTLFVWGSRVRNLVNDDELEGFSLVWRSAAAALFLGAAVIGAVALIKKRSFASPFFVAWSVAGIAWWTVRGTQTLVSDFSVAFKLVHTVLALVTIALGLLIIRSGIGLGAEKSVGRHVSGADADINANVNANINTGGDQTEDGPPLGPRADSR